MSSYWVYMLQCSDESYYTGVTSNLEQRIIQHNTGFYKGYTSTRLPVKLVFCQDFSDVNDAIKIEKQIKGWSRRKKEALINRQFELLPELSKKIFLKDSHASIHSGKPEHSA